MAATQRKTAAEKISNISISELYPFPNHPFKVRDDDSMSETVESIREHGVLVPAIARPREDGCYELIAGHRRRRACELAGLEAMPVLVRNLDDDAATIIMVDSNLQREEILPSERALILAEDEGFDLPRWAGQVAALACHRHASHSRSRSNPPISN